jgi:hypothetical protein
VGIAEVACLLSFREQSSCNRALRAGREGRRPLATTAA